MKTLYLHPTCTTCKRAVKWLDEHHIDYEKIDIRQVQPSVEQFQQILKNSGLGIKKLFNTSGELYRSLDLKNQLVTMSELEALTLLSTEGMLIKRPLLIEKDKVTVGFKEAEYEKMWGE